ncbi:MAG: hypothetical protein JOZ32_14255 [Bryobacterales bacterium]|nr:hypothetical protein [Bryobacterales bacterium]
MNIANCEQLERPYPLDIGILFALEEEAREIYSRVNCHAYLLDSSTGYQVHLFDSEAAKGHALYRCGWLCVHGQGGGSMQDATGYLIRHWAPATVVLIGIAGALSDDVRIGDVVVATGVYDYAHQRKATDAPSGGVEYKSAGDSSPTSERLTKIVQHLTGNLIFHGRSEITDEKWVDLLRGGTVRSQPSILSGLVASGATLSDSENFNADVLKGHRKALCIEMESLGFMKAYNLLRPGRVIEPLILRGISDRAKNKAQTDQVGDGALRRYACRNALDCLFALFKIKGAFLRVDTQGPAGSAGKSGLHRFPNRILDAPYVHRPSLEEQISPLFEHLEDGTRRVIAIHGGPGMGKTHLAVAEAQSALGLFPDGIFFVDLENVEANSEAVAEKIGTTLGIRQPTPAVVINALQQRRILIVLDNYEVMSRNREVAEFIQKLVDETDRLRLLVTGRWLAEAQDLGTGVRIHKGMSYEEAKEMFRELASKGRKWQLQKEEQRAFDRLLALCEYIPKAIELTAAMTYSEPLEKIARALEQIPLDETRGNKMDRALTRSMDRSFHLLDSEGTRKGFATLALFQNSFSAEAVDKILYQPEHRLLLPELCEKALLYFEPRDRYRMDRFTRDYALKKFDAYRTTDPLWVKSMEENFAKYYLGLAEQAIASLKSSDQKAQFDRLDSDIENINKALRWSVKNQPATGLQIVTAFGDFWASRGHARAGLNLFAELLEAADEKSPEFARAAFLAGHLHRHLEKFDRASELFDKSERAYITSHDFAGASAAVQQKAILAWHGRPEDETVRALLQEALDLALKSKSELAIAECHYQVGNLFRSHHKFPEAEREILLALKNYETVIPRPVRAIATGYLALGNVYVGSNSLEKAKKNYGRSLELFEEIADRGGRMAMLFERVAVVATASDRASDAATLLGAARRIREWTGAPLPRPDRRDFHDELVSKLQAALDKAEYEILCEQGASLPLSESIEIARRQLTV